MHLSNGILNTLGLDSSEFFFSNEKLLYDEGEAFGKVTFDNGHYHLVVGDIDLPRHDDDR
jgi:hypothetical protein